MECSAGNWMLHLDSLGRAYPCFSLETRKELATPAHLEIADQWKEVAHRRRELNSMTACLAEHRSV
jgi:hypothetical protein